jgi:branched-chain amino acid transport system ATP-binding protein
MVMALSDSIAVLKDGRLIADGPPAQVSASAEVQAAYFGTTTPHPTTPHPTLSPEGRG